MIRFNKKISYGILLALAKPLSAHAAVSYSICEKNLCVVGIVSVVVIGLFIGVSIWRSFKKKQKVNS